MKLAATQVALTAALMAAPALASDTAGGFTGPDNVPLMTAAEAIKLPDESLAKVQGQILKSLGDDKYEFRDNSGTVTVEIDGDDWRGAAVTPETKVELVVEVDRDLRRVELEAESVRLLP